jgi:3-hydroxyisobutyrate dehydrogenase-like beta-hydroxyacid dehydrogenase
MNLDTIGVVGAGPLATAIAIRLASAAKGVRVIAHGLEPVSRATLPKKARLEIAPNLFDLASECDAVIAAYDSHEALRSALTGSADHPGLLGAMRPGCLLVDLSAGLPDECRRLAGQLAGGAIGYIELAQLGGPDAIHAGSAQIYAGGFGDHIDQMTPILSQLGALKRIGPQGSARTFVALSQAVRAANALALEDVQAIAQASGFIPEDLDTPPLSDQERAELASHVSAALAQSPAHLQNPLLSILAKRLSPREGQLH